MITLAGTLWISSTVPPWQCSASPATSAPVGLTAPSTAVRWDNAAASRWTVIGARYACPNMPSPGSDPATGCGAPGRAHPIEFWRGSATWPPAYARGGRGIRSGSSRMIRLPLRPSNQRCRALFLLPGQIGLQSGSEAFDHQHSTMPRGPGSLMDVHPGSGLGVVGLATTAPQPIPAGTTFVAMTPRDRGGFPATRSWQAGSAPRSNNPVRTRRSGNRPEDRRPWATRTIGLRRQASPGVRRTARQPQ